MRKFVIITAMALIYAGLSAQEDYYWSGDKKVPLERVADKKFILFEASQDVRLKKSFAAQNTKVKRMDTLMVACKPYKSYHNQGRKWAIVENESFISEKMAGDEAVLYEAPFFRWGKGEIGLSHLFYVKLKVSEDVGLLEEMAEENGVEIIGNNEFMPLWYTLACSNRSAGNALQMANLFHESELFASAQSDLMRNYQTTCVNDSLFSEQWNLKNTGQLDGFFTGVDINYCKAREITSGNQNVFIALFDSGIEDHPDLNNIYPYGFDVFFNQIIRYVWKKHGTNCAGIIGATANNEQGVAGIAPDCPIISISAPFGEPTVGLVSPDPVPDANQMYANGFNMARLLGASIISNSWGVGDESSNPPPIDIMEDAIDNALTIGRNGLGCVVVFSSGNGDRPVSYPARCREDIIVVGTADTRIGDDRLGLFWGQFGEELDVVAPGIYIPTTSLQEFGGYQHDFSGTSASCPHVAAVAGLVLSVNPNLTQKQVGDIIESTTQKFEDYFGPYSIEPGRPNGIWSEFDGYGLVDAYAAVKAAVCFEPVNLAGQTVAIDTTVEGCDVNVEDVEVTNNAKLTIEAKREIIINAPFKAEKGAELEFKTDGW